jgi:predicted translin family RNA/ssDNA-binding protein
MAGLNKGHLGKIKKNLHAYHKRRGDVIGKANEALHHAKRAIFALHRDNEKEAAEKIKLVESIFKALNTKYKKDPDIKKEGAYKAGLEEYIEAKLFFEFVTTGKIGEIKDLPMDGDIYLAGLCDVPGELYRYAIKAATNKDVETAKKCAKMGGDIVGELIEFNLTSYLRTKFDQAKGAVNRLENVVYELSLRE